MGRTTWDELARALAVHEPTRIGQPVSSRAAVAVILREGADGLELLFIRRAEHPRDPWSGQMAFPGGRAEPGEDLAQTAIRETAEEVGLDLDAANGRLGTLDQVHATARGRLVDLVIQPFVFRVEPRAQADPGEEVRSIHWISLDALLAPTFRSTLRYEHEGASFELPCFRIGDTVIWGLTYRMFLNLEGVLRAAATG